MNTFFQQISAFLGRLPMQQRVAIGAVLVGGIVALTGVAYWANQPSYSLLFGNLGPSDASSIVEALRERNVRYRLGDGGTAVYVPQDDVYELRLNLAGEGLVTDGPDGYELFDRGTLGMTDFMQRLNMRRALEGELARTIGSIRQVDQARVHLVMPERSAFRETQIAPSASVVLKLSGAGTLGASQIEGIASLVAGAVEGLESGSVTVLDTQGSVLSSPEDEQTATALTATQLETQNTIEQALVQKGQSMLDRVLGPGNAIVRVSATLDFSRSIATRELIDPESATVVSEEKIDERLGNETGANSSIRNYEMSRTTETYEKGIGSIDFLTVSVILNQRLEGGDAENGTPGTPVPYATGEVSEIESLVMNAVGFSPDRGDRIAIHQTQFENDIVDPLAVSLEMDNGDQTALYLRYGLVLIALLMAFFLIRATARRAQEIRQTSPALGSSAVSPDGYLTAGATPQGLPQGSAAGSLSGGVPTERQLQSAGDFYQSRLSEESAATLSPENALFEEVKQLVSDSPEEAAEIIRIWMSDTPNA